jgi:hypothetical protein
MRGSGVPAWRHTNESSKSEVKGDSGQESEEIIDGWAD